MLQPEYCRQRQRRLLDVIQRANLSAVVLGRPRHVYYFTGHRSFWLHESAFVLFGDGRSLLYTANEPATGVAADEVETYEATWMGTQRQEQPQSLAAQIALRPRSGAEVRRVGMDASPVTSVLAGALRPAQYLDVEPDLWQLRRRKDPDELALMRKAIACTKAMYDRARQIIEPGVPELRVYGELHAAAVETTGEPLSPAYLGNDFRCAAPGGSPRQGRTAQSGELYILDLGPAYRGYFSDNCRTFAVDRRPTDAQFKAWQAVAGVFPIVERMARPGVRCRDLYAAADEHLRAAGGPGMTHHLGHGVGLQPHEAPHLNPRWDDVLAEGDVFTCEPGLYGPDLAAGLRIENQYLVTADGGENLTSFPMDLAYGEGKGGTMDEEP